MVMVLAAAEQAGILRLLRLFHRLYLIALLLAQAAQAALQTEVQAKVAHRGPTVQIPFLEVLPQL
jgi:hypothetical protein